MSRLKLSNIISKKNEVSQLLSSLAEQLNATICIEDEKGKTLFGEPNGIPVSKFPLVLNDEVLGTVTGDENVKPFADLLNLLLSKEVEKKKLGTEVLNLYQELNLIFNFSEKLAQLIEPEAIAQTALNEARHLIASNAGVVVLFDEQSERLNLLASSGKIFFSSDDINNNESIILKIAGIGQSEIITDAKVLQTINELQLQSIIYASLKVNHKVMGAIILFNDQPVQYTAGDLKLLTTLALQSSSAINSALLYEKNIRESREREEAMRRIHEITVKFVPHEFIRALGHDVITDVKLGDQVEKNVTVLFSDIRGYTSFSEQMTPEENFSFVCSFNELMGPVIRKNNGFINQYLGDAIMAIFPVSASDALTAAIEMQMSVQEFNKKRELKNQLPIEIGVGMHTGSLIMGITGDMDRMDATTISDTVNTASRIESLTKYYKGNIIISEDTFQQINNRAVFHFRHLGLVQLKGKQASISIYECFSGNTIQALQNKLSTLSLFNEGIQHYLNKSFAKANNVFQKVAEVDPNDLTAQFFLTNTTRFVNTEVPESRAGVVEMEEK